MEENNFPSEERKIKILYDIEHWRSGDIIIRNAMKIGSENNVYIDVELHDPHSLEEALKTKPRNDYDLVVLHVGNSELLCRYAKKLRDKFELCVPLVAESCLPRDRKAVLEYCDGYYESIIRKENFERILKDFKLL